MRGSIGFGLIVISLSAAHIAEARCPNAGWPDNKVCRKAEGVLVPGLSATAYFPNDAGGAWFGGGVQVVAAFWSKNTERFGPGQGKVIFDVNMLGSPEDDTGRMMLYRGGAQLSLERNASRNLFIPFFGFMFGGIHERAVGHHGMFEATGGMHLMFTKNVIVTVEGGYVFPFSAVDELAGPRVLTTANFTMW